MEGETSRAHPHLDFLSFQVPRRMTLPTPAAVRQSHVSRSSQVVGECDAHSRAEALHCWYSVTCEEASCAPSVALLWDSGASPERPLIGLCSRIPSEHDSGVGLMVVFIREINISWAMS